MGQKGDPSLLYDQVLYLQCLSAKPVPAVSVKGPAPESPSMTRKGGLRAERQLRLAGTDTVLSRRVRDETGFSPFGGLTV